jgi:putative salt-induced outer membrane protein YdiY
VVLALLAFFAVSNAFAQATVKTDGQWRSAISAGLSASSGNSTSRTVNIAADAVKATETDKWNWYGSQVFSKAAGVTTADLINIGGRYNQDLSAERFWFGQGDLLRNRPANLNLRSSAAGGMGYHLVKTDPLGWDVFFGLGYSNDQYLEETVVADRTRRSYTRLELLIGEESTHKLSSTTNLKQRLVLYPNVLESGQFRATLDASLSVAMSNTLSLTTTLGLRYNNDPGTGLTRLDTLLFTGISYKYE